MRSFRFLTLAAVSALIGSCSVEKPQQQEDERETLILSASSESSAATKTSRDADGTFFWSPGDQISIFRGPGDNGGALFRSRNDKREQVKEFVGTIDAASSGPFWGIYPYNTVNACYGETIVTEVPARQVAAEGTFADKQFISIGRSEGSSMTFYHLCGGIKFFLKEEGITRITLQDGLETPLAGLVEVALDGEDHPFVTNVLQPETEIVITPPEGEHCFRTGTDYFIVTLPVSFTEGFFLRFEKSDTGLEGTREVDANLTVHRAKFQWSERPVDAGVPFTPSGMDLELRDIENPEVRKYLETVDYSDDPDYTKSFIADFKGSDKPEPVCLEWDGGPAERILVSTSPDFEDILLQIEVPSSPAQVYNLVPGTVYFYRVFGVNGNILKDGCVMPVGPLRMVYGLSKNVRDLGGWPAGNKTIRYGKLFRGARLDDIQSKPEEKDVLFNTLGVDVDLDLRGLPPGTQGGSGEKNPWTPEDPIIYCNIQLWNYFVASTQQYRVPEIAEGATAEQYQYAIRRIIGWLSEDKVVYFHCHGGSDRTGTLAFLIEALLGVAEDDLSMDFELTYYSGSNRKRNCSSGWFYRPMVKYIRSFAPGTTIQEQATAWAKTRHSDAVDPLTDEEIAQLKALLLE